MKDLCQNLCSFLNKYEQMLAVSTVIVTEMQAISLFCHLLCKKSLVVHLYLVETHHVISQTVKFIILTSLKFRTVNHCINHFL